MERIENARLNLERRNNDEMRNRILELAITINANSTNCWFETEFNSVPQIPNSNTNQRKWFQRRKISSKFGSSGIVQQRNSYVFMDSYIIHNY
jgi:hypothetical protein